MIFISNTGDSIGIWLLVQKGTIYEIGTVLEGHKPHRCPCAKISLQGCPRLSVDIRDQFLLHVYSTHVICYLPVISAWRILSRKSHCQFPLKQAPYLMLEGDQYILVLAHKEPTFSQWADTPAPLLHPMTSGELLTMYYRDRKERVAESILDFW